MGVTPRRVAAFDVDGTLTRRDTLVPFVVRIGGLRTVAVTAAAAGRRGLRGDRDGFKAALLGAVFAGREPDAVAALAESYAGHVAGRLRSDTVAQLRWHRHEGHDVVIVSASLAVYLEPLGRMLGVDDVIAVDLEVGPDGLLTGSMTGPNVRGPEKAVRLREWLGEADVAHLWAYGDSAGDRELLAMADTPVWVGRRRPA